MSGSKPSGKIELTSFVHAAPYRETAHAGGQYVWAHARVLSDSCNAVYYAPDLEDNVRAGLDNWSADVAVRIVPASHSCYERAVQWLGSLLDVYRWNIGFARSVVRDAEVIERLRRSHTVELQWVEYIRLVGFVRRHAPAARVIGIVHDVVSSRNYRRARNSPRLSTRLSAGLVWRFEKFRERRWFDELDTAIVLSQKDADLLIDVGVRCKIEVVRPDLEEVGMFDASCSDRVPTKKVIFVGAFWRPENETAAVHLLEHIWPEIVVAHPDATLQLVGNRPSRRMYDAAAVHPSVTVTGYVESMAPYYRSAHCAVIPLRAGAGVKFKTVTAMLWGVPVVSTHVGTEGIADDDVFYAVADTDEGIIDGLVRCLDDDSAFADARRTRDWARSRYSARQFRQALESVYGPSRTVATE